MSNLYKIENRSLAIIYLYIISLFIPNELFWNLGSIRLEIYRLVLILSFIFLFNKIIIKKYLRHEVFLVVFCAWVLLTYIVNHGLSGLQSGMINFLEVFVSYIIGFTIAGKIENLKKVFKFIVLFFIILTPFAIVEALNGYRIFHVIFGELSGVDYLTYLGDNYIRFGIHRASTVFSHPILYSITSIALIPICFVVFSKRFALFTSFILAISIITSVTSAALLMLLCTIGFAILLKISYKYKGIFKFSLILLIFILIFIEIGSNRGAIRFIIDATSFNSHTAYTRYLQWIYVSENMKSSLLFGIGFADWHRIYWMPASIDSYWLVVGLRHGIMGLLLIFIFYISLLKLTWKKFRSDNNLIFYSFFISISALVLAAFTVDFFDRAKPIVYLLLGMYASFCVNNIGKKGDIKNE